MVNIPGYVFASDAQAAFDFVRGRLLHEWFGRTPVSCQALCVAVVVLRDPHGYCHDNGTLLEPPLNMVRRAAPVKHWQSNGVVSHMQAAGLLVEDTEGWRVVATPAAQVVLNHIQTYLDPLASLSPEQRRIFDPLKAEIRELAKGNRTFLTAMAYELLLDERSPLP